MLIFDFNVNLYLNSMGGNSRNLLDAVAMGTFPIHSYYACGSQWIEDGKINSEEIHKQNLVES